MPTLCCRPVPAQEYAQWLPCFEAAKTTMRDREAALDAAAELIERDLLLLGSTAIEDKLQQARLPASVAASPKSSKLVERHLVLLGATAIGDKLQQASLPCHVVVAAPLRRAAIIGSCRCEGPSGDVQAHSTL